MCTFNTTTTTIYLKKTTTTMKGLYRKYFIGTKQERIKANTGPLEKSYKNLQIQTRKNFT